MLGNLTVGRYRFVLQATAPLRLGAFAGATLRGGFGHVFKRTVCIWPPGECGRCLLKHTCAYPYLFETAPPPGAEKLRGLEAIPRPYVIEPPTDGRALYRPGERFDFGLVLVGRALDYLPYFLFTFGRLGETGLGPGRGRYDLAEVHTDGPDQPRCIYRGGDGVLDGASGRLTAVELAGRFDGVGRRLAVDFLTPARIRQEGAVRAEVSFQDLIRALLRRLSSLCYFHCGSELAVDFRGLCERAGGVRTVSSALCWQRHQRFSGRQEQWIEMSGVVGRVVYEVAAADDWQPYLPVLAAGEWVHVGKGTVMGLGKYRVEKPLSAGGGAC
jgi:hypothetical protein